MHFRAGKGSQRPEFGSWPDPGRGATPFSRGLSRSALGFHVSLRAVRTDSLRTPPATVGDAAPDTQGGASTRAGPWDVVWVQRRAQVSTLG